MKDMESNTTWGRISDCFFNEHNLTEHQIDSYNHFIQMKMSEIIRRSELNYKKQNDKIKSNHPKLTNYRLRFDNIYLKRPEIVEPSGIVKKLKPNECRIRNLSYMGDLIMDIHEDTIENDKLMNTQVHKDIFVGSIPIMIRSNWCHITEMKGDEIYKEKEDPYDFGGYFIINGIEKVLVSQDRMAHNENFIFKVKDTNKSKQTIKKQKNNKKKAPVYEWVAEVRSYSEHVEPNISTTVLKYTKEQLEQCEESKIYVDIPTLNEPIPWPVLYMALGITNPDDMIRYVCNEDDKEMIKKLKPSLYFPCIQTQEEAIEYISRFVNISQNVHDKLKQVKIILKKKFFQNVADMRMKRYYLGYITQQLLSTILGRRNPDDRDHYAKKRVDTAGGLMTNLFKSTWKRVLKDVKNVLEKKRAITIRSVFHSRITQPLKKAFGTGNWTGTKIIKSTKVGICQILNNLNYISRLSNIRRVKTPAEKNNKIVKPRHAHSSHFYYICLAETPEGQETGLLRNLAMLTTITTGSSTQPIIDWIDIINDSLLSKMDFQSRNTLKLLQSNTKILINGQWVAVTDSPEQLTKRLRSLRREQKIPYDVSISLTKEGIRIYTDEGRLLAPYIVIQNGTLPTLPATFTWNDLLKKGIIEYLDPAEAETMFISCYPWKLQHDHTHCFIDPSFIFGISAATVPFANHDQSPRVIYQSSMGKQALGMCAINYLHKYDSSNHVMIYGQRPLLETNAIRKVFDTKMKAHRKTYLPNTTNYTMAMNGNNLIVAIASYTGFNQEDSVIMNQSSIDNGILRSVNYTTYTSSHNKKGNIVSTIEKPHKVKDRQVRITGYTKIDEDGIPFENTPLTKKDVVIGEVCEFQQYSKDSSTVVKTNGMNELSVQDTILENGTQAYSVYDGYCTVDRSILTINEDSYRSVSVRTRQHRIPVIGDKVASRHAQKGIIGMILPHQDMPYSMSTGIVPDLIMNPNAMPSRMTTGQPLECLISKLCCLDAELGDCTPFRKIDENEIGDRLEQYGFERYGNEKMVNGMTGEVMEYTIFMGPTYYQRLKHMVSDKIHSRTQNGPREILTRQPVEGRKQSGGFRVGEMETWCGISHGASNFLIDRLVNNSDAYEMYVCNDCGNIAIAHLRTKRDDSNKQNSFECKRCQKTSGISKVKIPYAFKLLQQELMATGIGMWYDIDTNDE